jgi:hypothetical protein
MCLGLCSFIIAKEWFAMFIKMFGKLNSDYTSIFLPIMAKVQCTMLKQLNKTIQDKLIVMVALVKHVLDLGHALDSHDVGILMQSEITTIYTIVHGDEKTSQAEI